jgi:hypothetical protein
MAKTAVAYPRGHPWAAGVYKPYGAIPQDDAATLVDVGRSAGFC